MRSTLNRLHRLGRSEGALPQLRRSMISAYTLFMKDQPTASSFLSQQDQVRAAAQEWRQQPEPLQQVGNFFIMNIFNAACVDLCRAIASHSTQGSR